MQAAVAAWAELHGGPVKGVELLSGGAKGRKGKKEEEERSWKAQEEAKAAEKEGKKKKKKKKKGTDAFGKHAHAGCAVIHFEANASVVKLIAR